MTALEPPACIAIVGAGPIGIEAALYARYLGYRVQVFEMHDVGSSVRGDLDAPLWEPYARCVTPLGLQALSAQDRQFKPPARDAQLTVGEWMEGYLQPLAQSDLIADSLMCQRQVVSVQCLPVDEPGEEDWDEDHPEPERFELQVRDLADPSAEEARYRVSAVMDASGGGAPGCEVQAVDGQIVVPTCVDAAANSPQDLILSVPHFYRIGATSHDREMFRLATGHDQIRDLFKLIGARDTLDLY